MSYEKIESYLANLIVTKNLKPDILVLPENQYNELLQELEDKMRPYETYGTRKKRLAINIHYGQVVLYPAKIDKIIPLFDELSEFFRL